MIKSTRLQGTHTQTEGCRINGDHSYKAHTQTNAGYLKTRGSKAHTQKIAG